MQRNINTFDTATRIIKDNINPYLSKDNFNAKLKKSYLKIYENMRKEEWYLFYNGSIIITSHS